LLWVQVDHQVGRLAAVAQVVAAQVEQFVLSGVQVEHSLQLILVTCNKYIDGLKSNGNNKDQTVHYR
jgi:hypothetical protein